MAKRMDRDSRVKTASTESANRSHPQPANPSPFRRRDCLFVLVVIVGGALLVSTYLAGGGTHRAGVLRSGPRGPAASSAAGPSAAR